MSEPDPVKSNSPDTFLRRQGLGGADASTDPINDTPIKTTGDMDTLYQKTERTTKPAEITDPRDPRD